MSLRTCSCAREFAGKPVQKKVDAMKRTSFPYLEPGVDYPLFPLPERDWAPAYTVPLNEEEEKIAARYLAAMPIASMRDHGFVVPKRSEDIIPYCRQLHTAYDYEGLRQSGLNLVFDNFMDGIALLSSSQGQKWDDCVANLGIRLCDLSFQEGFSIVRDARDVERALSRKDGVAIVASMETASPIENELDRIDILYGLGIRCMGITYNDANALGSGLSEAGDGGLTAFGRKAVKRMNRLGMAIDISHCGPRTALDVVRASDKPVLMTHTGARALWDSPRMASDELLLACAERGGVVGVCAAPGTTLAGSGADHSIEDVMAHFEYIVELIGIDRVGLGSDTFYGDHVALQIAFDRRLMLSESHGEGAPHATLEYVRGAENPNEATANIVRWLVKHGYSETEMEKVLYRNVADTLQRIMDR